MESIRTCLRRLGATGVVAAALLAGTLTAAGPARADAECQTVTSVGSSVKATSGGVRFTLRHPVKLATVEFYNVVDPSDHVFAISAFQAPSTSHGVQVKLTPDTTYSIKVNAPDPVCGGPGLSALVGDPVKTWRRVVTLTFDKVYTVDDSDDPWGCAEVVSMAMKLDSAEKHITSTPNMCSGQWDDPANTSVTAPNVKTATVETGIGAIEDDTAPFDLATYGLAIDWTNNTDGPGYNKATGLGTLDVTTPNDTEVWKTHTVGAHGPALDFTAHFKVHISYVP